MIAAASRVAVANAEILPSHLSSAASAARGAAFTGNRSEIARGAASNRSELALHADVASSRARRRLHQLSAVGSSEDGWENYATWAVSRTWAPLRESGGPVQVVRGYSDSEWVKERDRGAQAAAAKIWRRFSKRLRNRPGKVYETVFMLLDSEQKGCVALREAVRFIGFVIPCMKPCSTVLALACIVPLISRTAAARFPPPHSCSTFTPLFMIYRSCPLPPPLAVTMPTERAELRRLSMLDAARAARDGSSGGVLLRSEFVDLCLRLLYSIPLSQLASCMEEYTSQVEAAALPVRWVARTRDALDAARHTAAYRAAKAEAVMSLDRRIKARRAGELEAQFRTARDKWHVESLANGRAAERVEEARQVAVRAEATRREMARALAASTNPLPRWYAATGLSDR